MPVGNEKEEIGRVARYLHNRYWFIGSALFFILVASIYLIFTPSEYKVTTRTQLNNNQFPKEVIDQIKSKFIIQKTLDQLPLSVTYYYESFFKKTAIDEDSLPIKFLLLQNNAINNSAELVVTILDNQRYEFNQDDTLTDFFFNKPANYSSAKFIGVKGPAFKTETKPVIIRFYRADQLLKHNDNLEAKFADDSHKTIELSVITASTKNGRAFLSKLVRVYNKYYKIIGIPNESAFATYNMRLQKLSAELAILKLKAKKLADRQAAFLAVKEKTVNKKTTGQESAQLNTLNDIQLFIKGPENQFVLISDVYEVADGELKKLIAQFNNLEWDRQHALQNPQPDFSKIANLNKQLTALKQIMLQRINIKKNEINNDQSSYTKNSNKVDPIPYDSILKINALLKSKTLAYNHLLQNKPERTQIKTKTYTQTIIEIPDEHVITYPKPGYVYGLALLIGLALPLTIPYFKHRANLIFDSKKWRQKTMMIFNSFIISAK